MYFISLFVCSFNINKDLKIEIKKNRGILKKCYKIYFCFVSYSDDFHHKDLKITASYAYLLPNSQAEFPIILSITICLLHVHDVLVKFKAFHALCTSLPPPPRDRGIAKLLTFKILSPCKSPALRGPNFVKPMVKPRPPGTDYIMRNNERP